MAVRLSISTMATLRFTLEGMGGGGGGGGGEEEIYLNISRWTLSVQ